MSEGVSRKAVKRRFLWRLGRERSCSEEGIGSPIQATTLVFYRQGNFTSGCRSGNSFGRVEFCASAKAFASGIIPGLLGIRLVSPSGVLPLVHRVLPIWAVDQGRPCKQ